MSTTTNRDFIDRVLAAVTETERDGLLTDHRGRGLSGISGLKSVGLLQRLQRLISPDRTACYLEIGVFQGLTLVSAALEAPEIPCIGVDNFRILDPGGENLAIVNQRIASFATKNARLLNMDFEAALETFGTHAGGRKVAVYFVDGPHDYRSQLVCLLLAKRHLHERAVIVIDDANYADVRFATRDFLLSHPEFKMVFEAYTADHPANMDDETKRVAEAGWLNGVNVLVTDPENLLPPMLPDVPADRTLYYNEWLTHRLRLAELAPEALILADAVVQGRPAEERAAAQQLNTQYLQKKLLFDGRVEDRNVNSKGLTKGRMSRLTPDTR